MSVAGLNVQLAAGTVNSGDSFSENVTADPDSAKLLSSLGLNSFFVGSTAADLQVDPSLLNNPQPAGRVQHGRGGRQRQPWQVRALQASRCSNSGRNRCCNISRTSSATSVLRPAPCRRTAPPIRRWNQQLSDQRENSHRCLQYPTTALMHRCSTRTPTRCRPSSVSRRQPEMLNDFF